MMRWRMPPPPRTGGPPSPTFATSSPHWRGWLMPESRCLVPANSFAEYAPEPNPETKRRTWCGFALNEDRPLFAFAGIWTEFKGERGPKSKPIPGPASRLWLPDRLRRAQANHASPRRPLHHRTAQDRTRCRMAGRNGGAGADYQRWRPMVMARIGMMQDAALQIADAVQTTKIGRRPKSPVMLFGPESYFD